MPYGLYVFTGINRLGPAWAQLLSEVHAQVQYTTGIAPLNHPVKTLRRFELLKALHEAGLNDFRAFGAWEDLSDLRFPAFVRPREQDGGIPQLLHSLGEVEAAVGKQLMEGWSIHGVLVIEFEDTSDEAGTFKKYSAYIVGNRIIPVSIDWGSRWVMRSDGATVDPGMIEEEMSFVRENPHGDQLKRIFSIARTQFGRIDYSMKSGRVQTWEINTLPLLRTPRGRAPVPEELRALRAPRREHFKAEFTAAWREIIPDRPAGPSIRIAIAPGTLALARTELETRGISTEPPSVMFPRIRRFLRPLKALLKPIAARILHPLLGKRARRAFGTPQATPEHPQGS